MRGQETLVSSLGKYHFGVGLRDDEILGCSLPAGLICGRKFLFGAMATSDTVVLSFSSVLIFFSDPWDVFVTPW